MDSQYYRIANDKYPFAHRQVTNQGLRDYFNSCFDEVFELSGAYPAWACLTCATTENKAVFFEPPQGGCKISSSHRVFEVATFQSRASRMGSVFECAVRVLFKEKFSLDLRPTPQNTTTHDLEASALVAIEVKGSPERVRIPNYGTRKLERPGLLRSDTLKKAQANGRRFKQSNPNGYFFVLTNALPPSLRGIRSEDITGFFDLTKTDRVRAFVNEVREIIH